MINLEKVSFSYIGSSCHILNEINLQIKAGEYISVVGDNGSGKSTLLKLILGFLNPTSGLITSNAIKIGYVPQKNDYSNSTFPITVYEMLNSYRKLLKIKEKEVIENCLEQVGMSQLNCKKTLVGNLSGGQMQRILIARALMGNPDLLILDEPATGMDANSQKEMYALLKKFNTENGITILSVEHNLDAAVSSSTLIYHLSGGRGHLCTPQKYAQEFLTTNN